MYHINSEKTALCLVWNIINIIKSLTATPPTVITLPTSHTSFFMFLCLSHFLEKCWTAHRCKLSYYFYYALVWPDQSIYKLKYIEFYDKLFYFNTFKMKFLSFFGKIIRTDRLYYLWVLWGQWRWCYSIFVISTGQWFYSWQPLSDFNHFFK